MTDRGADPAAGRGRVAVVTGAAGFVGGCAVRRLAAAGWRVAGIDLDSSAAQLSLRTDVTNLAALQLAAAGIDTAWGPVELLVTAAGVYDAAPAGEMPRERWRRLLDTMLGGTANAVRAFVPRMVTEGRGTVITTSSWLAQAGRAGDVYYATASGTVLAFTRSLACEVARHGVRVNCIAVGPMKQGSFATGRAPAADVPLCDESPSPESVADTILFLADEGDFYVGQVFTPNYGAVI